MSDYHFIIETGVFDDGIHVIYVCLVKCVIMELIRMNIVI